LSNVVMTRPEPHSGAEGRTKKAGPGGGSAPAAAPRKRSALGALWHSSIGKKWVMAVTGLFMVLFLLAHMIGNLKIFFGKREFDDYASWIRNIGQPALHHEWFLWINRVALLVAVVLHVTAAIQLSRRDHKARPVKYASGQRPQATFATHTMRYGGIILALFIVWHILDLTTGVVNPSYKGVGFHDGHVYQNVYDDFSHWWSNVIYLVAMVMLGLHINHGFWSASQTLGINSPKRDVAIKATGSALAVILTVGFAMVPIGVMTGIVH
jgi:succinate dehydrogenase / fumarate reductase cytochrome b subunit